MNRDARAGKPRGGCGNPYVDEVIGRREATLRRFAACLAAAGVLLFGTAAFPGPRDLVGKPAPDFKGASPFGKPVSLSAFRGKAPAVLTFWSIYCTTCIEEMAGLQRLYEKYGPEGIAVVAVNEDADVGVGRVKAFLDRSAESKEGKFTYDILFDGKGDVLRAYGVSRLPTLFFIDRGGTVREVIEGGGDGREMRVVSAIGKLVGTVGPEGLREAAAEASFDLDAKVPLCGTYRDGKWYRPLDLDERRQDVVARSRAEGEEALRREAVRRSLLQLGVTLSRQDRTPGCGATYGMELRSLYSRKDALGRFVDRLNLPRVLEVESQETLEGERELTLYRRIKVNLPALREQFLQDGYSTERSDLRIRFARATPFEERTFVEALYEQYPYLSTVREVPSELRGRPEYVVSSHATPAKAVERLNALNVGARKIAVELLAGGIAEVTMWR
jgi:cytochrome c biogenesis protein CcmG/thiol:disulfide interchange protein DsbE